MIDKSINMIDCTQVRAQQKSEANQSMELDPDIIYNTTYIKSYNGSELIDVNITGTFDDLKDEVCKAEIDSQILDSALNVYTAPFGKHFEDTFSHFLLISKFHIAFNEIRHGHKKLLSHIKYLTCFSMTSLNDHFVCVYNILSKKTCLQQDAFLLLIM